MRAAPFIKLKDPSEADALVKDCDAHLAKIPGAVRVHCGRPVETGRAEVTADYDVGVYIAFDSVESCRGYVDHPEHLAVLAAWRP